MNLFSRTTRKGRVGLEIGPAGIAMVKAVARQAGARQPLSCRYLAGTVAERDTQALRRLIKESGFRGLPATIVLHPDDYRIFFVERPDVADEDISEAVKWQLKDQIDQPLADLVVDAFNVPDDAFRGSARMVYAITANRAVVQGAVDFARQAGLKVDSVQVAELATHNIMNLLQEPEHSTALLQVRETSSTIVLSESGSIYLTRKIESGARLIAEAGGLDLKRRLDDLQLDIQRSMDYYES